MLGPARSAVCCRGDDFYNPHVQVSGCRERHLLSRFIVNLFRNLQSPPAHDDLCAKAQKKGAQCHVTNTYVQRAVRNSRSS
jgi:hypothetical protein